MDTKAVVKSFFEKDTSTCQHIFSCPKTRDCAIVDSVLDFAPHSGKTSTTSAEQLIAYVRENRLNPKYILETHVHADHLSAAPFLQQAFPDAVVGIGDQVTEVQRTFQRVFNLGAGFRTDGSQFDRLFRDNDSFNVGSLQVHVLHTPGHTPACVSYYVADDCVFTGDTLFMPDSGTARCDFPGGSSEALWKSIQRILALPAHVRVFTCHDYQPGGREAMWESTIADERAANVHVKAGTEQAHFTSWRAERDAKLDQPRLIIPAIQVNIRAGRFPSPEANGTVYLKVPVNLLATGTGVFTEKT